MSLGFLALLLLSYRLVPSTETRERDLERSTLKINGIQVGKSNPNLVIVAWPKRSPETEDVVIPSTNRS